MKRTITLKKNYEFRTVLTKGTYFSGNFIEGFMMKNKQEKNYLGIAIGTKIAKANKRNQIKRLVRENYRLLEDRLKVGYTIVFLWKKKADIGEANFHNISKDMQRIFRKIGLFINEEDM